MLSSTIRIKGALDLIDEKCKTIRVPIKKLPMDQLMEQVEQEFHAFGNKQAQQMVRENVRIASKL